MIERCWASAHALYRFETVAGPGTDMFINARGLPSPSLSPVYDIGLSIVRYPWDAGRRAFGPPQAIWLEPHPFWRAHLERPGGLFPVIRAHLDVLGAYVCHDYARTWKAWQEDWHQYPGAPPTVLLTNPASWYLSQPSWFWVTAVHEQLVLVYASRQSWVPSRYTIKFIVAHNPVFPLMLLTPGFYETPRYLKNLTGWELKKLARFIACAPESFLACQVLSDPA